MRGRDSLRPRLFLRSRTPAARVPTAAPVVSITQSIPSMDRPGMKAWCVSSTVPKAARAPVTARARSSVNPGRPGHRTAKSSRNASTP